MHKSINPKTIILLTMLIIASFAITASAKLIVITLNDGRQVEGEFISDLDQIVTIKINNIPIPFPRENIVRIETKLTLSEQYAQRLADLDPKNLNAQLDLVRWLYNKNTHQADTIAYPALLILVRDNPNSSFAKLLLDAVSQRIYEYPEQQQFDSTTPTYKPSDTDKTEPTDDLHLLSDEDINLIKIMEIDLSTKPNVSVPSDVINELFDNYRDNDALEKYLGRAGEAKFRQLKGYQQLEVMFNAKARPLYKKVIVRTEPQALKTYRLTINKNYVMNYCGKCHNSSNPGNGLTLITSKSRKNNEAIAYTNFYILHKSSAPTGKLINRNPNSIDTSILLQYGLPYKEATYRHPDVPHYRPYFNGRKDQRFKNMVKWIKSLYSPTPSYMIDYVIPGTPPPKPDEKEINENQPPAESLSKVPENQT